MTIKVALLQSQQQVIAELKEIVSEDKPVAYLFTRPHLVEFNKFSLSENESNQTSIEVSLSPWILASADKEIPIPIPINQVIALVEPLESIKKMYLEKTNGSSNQTDSSNDGTESDKSD